MPPIPSFRTPSFLTSSRPASPSGFETSIETDSHLIHTPEHDSESAPVNPIPVRSRSTSVGSPGGLSMFGTSPLMVARALHSQHSPPPFLQRRRYHQDTSVDTLSDMLESGDLTSAAVPRPLSRRPDLLPKPKSHLRVLSQLQDEQSDSGFEVRSEATLHRVSRAGASTIPGCRHTSCPLPPKPLCSPSSSRPTPNRFPEQAGDENDDDGVDSSSSGDDIQDAEMQSWCSNSMGYATDDEERKMARWTEFRSMSVHSTKSPGSEKSRMELEFPSTPGPSSTGPSRPGKRKLTEDRGHPYAQFKRRAVSPATSSLGSPTMSGYSSLPIPSPMSLPSPSSHPSFLASLERRSRAGSPAPTSGRPSFTYGAVLCSSSSKGETKEEIPGDDLKRMRLE